MQPLDFRCVPKSDFADRKSGNGVIALNCDAAGKKIPIYRVFIACWLQVTDKWAESRKAAPQLPTSGALHRKSQSNQLGRRRRSKTPPTWSVTWTACARPACQKFEKYAFSVEISRKTSIRQETGLARFEDLA